MDNDDGYHVLVQRIIAEFSETCDAPSDFSEVEIFVNTLRKMIGWCKLPVPSAGSTCVMFLQKTRFSWDILAKAMQKYGVSFDDNWQVPTKDDLAMPPTTGFINLDTRIPNTVICSSETGLPLSEVVFVVSTDHGNPLLQWKGFEPSEFVEYVMEMHTESIHIIGNVYGGNSETAKNFLHNCAVQELISMTPAREASKDEDIRPGHIVRVLTESNSGDSEEYFLVSELTGDNIGGFWLYKEEDIPIEIEEDSIDNDAATMQRDLYVSDHFDIVHKTSLLTEEIRAKRRNLGEASQSIKSSRIPIREFLPRIKGAYSQVHKEILHARSLSQYMNMLEQLDVMSIEECGLGLFKNISDRVSCILPGGIDSSLERAADLSGLLWSGGCNLEEIAKVPGNCDCCGLDRTISYVLNGMLYLGSSCAKKIQRLSPEILKCRRLAENPAHLLDPFKYTTTLAIIERI